MLTEGSGNATVADNSSYSTTNTIQKPDYYLLKSIASRSAIGPFPLQELAAGYGEALGWQNFRIDTDPDFDVTIEKLNPDVCYHPAFYQHPNAAQYYLFAPHPKPIFSEPLEAAGFAITNARITEEPIAFIGKWAIAIHGNRVVLVDSNGFKWWKRLLEGETEEEAVASVRKLLTFGNPVNSKFRIVNSKLKAAKAAKVFVGERFSYQYHFGNEALALAARRIKGSAIALVRRTFADIVQLGHSLWDLKFDCIAQLGAEGKQAFKDWLSEDFGGSKYLADAAMKLAPWYESLDAKTQRLVSLNVHEWSVAALKELTKLTGKALAKLIRLGWKTARQIKEFRVNHSPVSPEDVNKLLAKHVTADGQPLSLEDAERVQQAARELTEGEAITFGTFKQALEDLGYPKSIQNSKCKIQNEEEKPPTIFELRERMVTVGILKPEPNKQYRDRLVLERPEGYSCLPFPQFFDNPQQALEWWQQKGEEFGRSQPLPVELQNQILDSYRPPLVPPHWGGCKGGDAAEVEQIAYRLRLPAEPEIEQLKQQLAEERAQREEAIKQAIAQTQQAYQQERDLLVQKWEEERRERTAIERQYQELQAAQLEIEQLTSENRQLKEQLTTAPIEKTEREKEVNLQQQLNEALAEKELFEKATNRLSYQVGKLQAVLEGKEQSATVEYARSATIENVQMRSELSDIGYQFSIAGFQGWNWEGYRDGSGKIHKGIEAFKAFLRDWLETSPIQNSKFKIQKPEEFRITHYAHTT